LDAGFDFIELGATGFEGESEDWDPRPFEGLPVEATNLFFPGHFRLVGQDATDYLPYAQRTIERAASLGVQTMVVGSGGARRAPEGVDGETAFVNVCARLSEIALARGVAIAPESLNRRETNVGTDLRSLALALQAVQTGYTADAYHVLTEWDLDGRVLSLEELWREQLPFSPTHVHIAELSKREHPQSSDETLQEFACRLQDLAYDGRICLECSRGEDFEFGLALKEVRTLFNG
jgi:sugar phosphate isomerase/epimerase